LHVEELHELNFSPNIIYVDKSSRMRCAGHIVFAGGIWKKETTWKI